MPSESDSASSKRVGQVRCPNCNQTDTRHDLTQEGFEEHRCQNENCLVEVFRVE